MKSFLVTKFCILAFVTSFLVDNLNAQTVSSQEPTVNPYAIQLQRPQKQQWEIGFEVKSPALMTGVTATITIPMSWPEQKVKIIEQDLSPGVRVRSRVVMGDVKQLLVTVPRVEAGSTIKTIVTVEVERSLIEKPKQTDKLYIPKLLTPDLRKYMGVSPFIETTHPKIVAVSRGLGDDGKNAWHKAEIIFDWVRDHVKYKFDEELKGALLALEKGEGDCEELTSLFIAICRNNGIPARSVWIPGHCYPEFYLEDASGGGHWFPCQIAGSRSFGSMPEYRPVLQKGDNFRIPGNSQPQRYVAETFKALRLTQPPMVQFIRRQSGSDDPFAPVLK